jgi:negative regulator of flagellin synthesis FlgM
MDIRNSLEGLRSLLGADPTAPSASQGKGNASAAPSTFDSDRATFSNAANEVSQSASGEGVRADKVAAIQAALAAGTYNVPASAVASRMIDSMLTTGSAAGPS